MADPYVRFQGTSNRLFTKWKQGTVTLTRVTPGTPTPGAEWEPVADSTVTYALKATVRAVEFKFIDGTTVILTDDQVNASPIMIKTHVDGDAVTNVDEALEVLPGDTMSIDGKAVTIINPMRIPKAGTAVMWKVVVRG